MELYNNDCLEVMKDLSSNSIDLLFCDLPYGQTSCKWDTTINLELFWKQVNRICKINCPMFFTTTTRFGVDLINSNPKNFRYDLVWVKTTNCGFLNAKKMPMRKHEMIYVFYRKLPLYDLTSHSHKFIDSYKPNTNETKEDLCYGEGSHNNEYKGEARESNVYDPPLPTSVITTKLRQDASGLYGNEPKKIFIYVDGKLKNSEPRYDPPLPNSVIKIGLKDTIFGDISVLEHSNRKDRINIYDPPLPVSVIQVKEKYKVSTNEVVYRPDLPLKQYQGKDKQGPVFDPPLPVSVIKTELVSNILSYRNKAGQYDPPLPNSIIKEDGFEYKAPANEIIYNKLYIKQYKGRKDGEPVFDPPLPNSLLEIKSQKGKHSTQKPTELMKWILKYYSKEGDTVLDPTMGSGSTGVACKEMNRKFIGIEKDEKIYKSAVERLN